MVRPANAHVSRWVPEGEVWDQTLECFRGNPVCLLNAQETEGLLCC